MGGSAPVGGSAAGRAITGRDMALDAELQVTEVFSYVIFIRRLSVAHINLDCLVYLQSLIFLTVTTDYRCTALQDNDGLLVKKKCVTRGLQVAEVCAAKQVCHMLGLCGELGG